MRSRDTTWLDGVLAARFSLAVSPPYPEVATSGAGAQLPLFFQVSHPHGTTPHTDAISLRSGVSLVRSPGAAHCGRRRAPGKGLRSCWNRGLG